MTVYTSRAHREGSWWIVQCDEAPGAISQVKRLTEAQEAQREAIAFVLEVPAEDVSVRLLPTIGREIDTELAELRDIRAESAVREARASQLSRSVARALNEQGLTVREIAVMLGISHQRASQLLASSSGKASERTAG